MILAVNIGNTNTTIARYQGQGEWMLLHRIPTAAYRTESDFLAQLPVSLLCADAAVFASVVPKKNEIVAGALERICTHPPLQIAYAEDCGLDLSAYDASLLGMDRVLCCVGALENYAPPLAVFDLGTAISISVIDAQARFIGGAIMPGLQMGLGALANGTALLPAISLQETAPLIGHDTASCLQSGAIYGAAGAIDGYARQLGKQFDHLTLVATGGSAPQVLPYCTEHFQEHSTLLMQGLSAVCKQHLS